MSEAASVSRGVLWTGRILQALVVLFLLFDAITKIIKVAPVMQAFARLGYPQHLAPVIGTILLVCTVLYVIPQTSVLGAILLTAYLGGAVEVNLRAGDPVFETLFPAIFGVLVWLALYLRDRRLWALVPLRRPEA
ncbi:MAG: DoxX family protein [Candidatus Acidiferrales bacterium]